MKKLTVLQAIRSLSSVCDGAKEKDGQGFAACDVHLKPNAGVSKLTLQQQLEYQPILFRYKKQLGIETIDQLEIEKHDCSDEQIWADQKAELEDWSIRKLQKTVTFKNSKAIITSGYSPVLISRIKAISGAHFNWETKAWSFPVSKDNAAAVINFLKSNYFDFNEADVTKTVTAEPEVTDFIELKGKTLVFHFAYDVNILAAVKRIPKRKFSMDTKTWSADLNIENVTMISEVIKSFPFKMDKSVVAQIQKLLGDLAAKQENMKTNLADSKSLEADFEVPMFKGTLRPFQKAGVKYIVKNKRVLVGDEMGLGKTIETIAAIQYSGNVPALINCPNTLKLNWQREIKKFTDYKVVVLNSDDKVIPAGADIYVTNYNALVKHAEELSKIKFQTLVADESHYLKNNKAQRTQAFTGLVEKCNPEFVLLLTGTAIVNRPSELISPLTILDKLNDFGGFWGYAKQYCGAYRDKFGLNMSGATNLPELHEKLRSLCYIRRNKSEVLTELPAKNRQVIELEINNRAKYEKAKNDLISYLKAEAREDKKFIDSIQDLNEEEQRAAKKIYREQKAKNAEAAEHLVRINELKQLTVEGKLDEAKAWIKDVIETGEKLVVFAIHTKVVNELAKEFGCRKINGETSAEERDAAVQDFQNNPETKLIVLNIQAGSVGLTLTAAQKLAFVELGWTPGEHDQAEDRIHRIGQVGSVNIYYLIASDTVDIDIYDLIEKKREITNVVNKGEYSEGNISIMNELIGKLTK